MVSAAAVLRAHLTRRRVQALRSGGGGGGYSSYPPPPPGEPGELGAHPPRRPRALSRVVCACAGKAGGVVKFIVFVLIAMMLLGGIGHAKKNK